MSTVAQHLTESLSLREQSGTLRKLYNDGQGVDFITNDYLGFSKLITVETDTDHESTAASRLLGGNNKGIEELESDIALFHGFESALFYNSGYTANIGLFSCLLTRHDTYIYDSRIHASIRDGIRLSMAQAFSFEHNNIDDLTKKLQHAKGNVVVVVEAVYSMDGDKGELNAIVQCCKQNGAELVVDEAHSIGIFGKEGRGMVHELGLQNQVLAVVYTYGKAMGCHGGAIACNTVLKNYLINFSRPFIYTTAPSMHTVTAVKIAYRLLQSPVHERNKLNLRKNILVFVESMNKYFPEFDVQESHINKLTVGGVGKTIEAANRLRAAGYICRPVLSPTVEAGSERIRINLHAFNTVEQIQNLILEFKTIAHG